MSVSVFLNAIEESFGLRIEMGNSIAIAVAGFAVAFFTNVVV